MRLPRELHEAPVKYEPLYLEISISISEIRTNYSLTIKKVRSYTPGFTVFTVQWVSTFERRRFSASQSDGRKKSLRAEYSAWWKSGLTREQGLLGAAGTVCFVFQISSLPFIPQFCRFSPKKLGYRSSRKFCYDLVFDHNKVCRFLINFNLSLGSPNNPVISGE